MKERRQLILIFDGRTGVDKASLVAEAALRQYVWLFGGNYPKKKKKKKRNKPAEAAHEDLTSDGLTEDFDF